MNKQIENSINRLQDISEELKSMFLERDTVIDNSIKALITGQTVLLIGPPGTAKSALTHELCDRIHKANYFSWLLNRTSDPAEILGPYSIREMENDKFLRVTKNKLPEAEIAFLDEIFKCNEPTLNILLPLINEKLFFNDGVPENVPLITLFAASNEFPDEESLEALYDRMMFRMEVNYISDQQNKLRMLKGFMTNVKLEPKRTTITIDELSLLRDALNHIEISDSVLYEYISLMNKLLQNGIVISDRRQNECLKILRANALLNYRSFVSTSDFEALKDTLWNEPEDIEIVLEILRDHLVSPLTKEYNTIKNRYQNILSSSQNINDTRLLVEVKGTVDYLLERTSRLLIQSEESEPEVFSKSHVLKKELNYYLDILKQTIGDDEDDALFGIG